MKQLDVNTAVARSRGVAGRILQGIGALSVVGAVGIGGLALTSDDAMADELRSIASFSWDHEARNDPFQLDAGLNSFELKYPDGSKEWCTVYIIRDEPTPMHCKPATTAKVSNNEHHTH